MWNVSDAKRSDYANDGNADFNGTQAVNDDDSTPYGL
jgi:hypothetical protein